MKEVDARWRAKTARAAMAMKYAAVEPKRLFIHFVPFFLVRSINDALGCIRDHDIRAIFILSLT
jgi:hypothetical protein